MKKLLAAAVLVTAAASAMAQSVPQPEPDVIYGSDDRRDLYQVQDKKVLQLADSTVALFQDGDVTVEGPAAKLTTQHYGESYRLCKEEPFYDQSVGAFCSGSLVGPDLIMTAGHCVTSQESCAATKFVFGFGIMKEGVSPASVPAGEVYGCAKLLGREQTNNGADWALIQVDRAVAGHKALKLDLSGNLETGDLMFVIGHPAGLPTKVAGGAKVRDASPNGYYVATLDTYGGNSGSAVFNAKTGLVTGILVRGENDYIYKGDCRVSNVCTEEACRGEDVTKIGSVGFPPRSEAGSSRLAAFGSALSELLERNANALQ